MKLAKKSLSIFLALLMLFSACSVGLTGIVASAAPGDSKYSADQVIDLVNAATENGFTMSSASNEWNYTADDGSALAAADAIFDYAVKTYREGRDADSKGNSTKALYDYFTAEFSSQYANATAADRLVKNVLDPDGSTIFSFENPGTKDTTFGESTTAWTVGSDYTSSFPIASNSTMYAEGISLSDVTTKKAFVQVDMTKYLTQFNSIDEIPSSFLTSVSLTYNHVTTYSATVSKVDTRSESHVENEGTCDEETVITNYYTPTISTTAYNYMTGKPVRQVVKNTTAKKNLLALEKFFTEELYANTRESMLQLPLNEIEALYKSADSYYNVMKENFSETVINHFNLGYDKIKAFMDDCSFAYRVVAGMHNIDVLNTYIGSEYNVDSYASMSSLYSKVNTAYNVVYSMDSEIVNYIINDAGYADEYNSAIALKADAESYMATLYDVMTEQRLDELAASMVKTFEDYINVLNKEDIETPADAEVLGLVQKVEGYDSVLATYTSKAYYRTYWPAEYESEWARFKGILDEVVEVRGLKMEFETYYDYFMPILFTNMIVDLDNASAIALHSELDTKLTELRTSYNEILTKWGGTIADKIFKINYEGSDYLLQTLIDTVKSTGKEAVKANLIARTEAQLDAVAAYSGITTVDFSNFASIKSTLTYFDYDLYNYVIDNNLGLSSAYVNKYSQVQTLLDKYHAFSTTDGHAFFNEDFTYADENGNYAVRYAGDQTIEVEGEDDDGNPVTTTVQIGYPSDLARSGSEDNYYVTADKMENTVARLDNFIVSRDFGALLGFTNEEEEYIGLEEYLLLMIEDMLYTDDMMNTLVGAIFPMICELIEAELVGALGTMDGARLDENGVPWLSLSDLLGSSLASGDLALYLDTMYAPGNPGGHQKNFMQVFADLGLYIYPATLAESLLLSNPASYGVGSPIYEALKAAGRDWTQLVCADDPETPAVDETKALAFEWGVYDEDSFIEVMSCILDSILPLLQAVLTDKPFEGESSNAAVAYSDKVTAAWIFNANNIFIRGGLKITIDPLNAWNTIFVPLFEVLGVEKIPTVSSDASGYDIADALIGTLLKRVKDILKSPLTSILDILPNLVYFVSMDSVQEIINSLKIHLNLNLHELDVYSGSGLVTSILSALEGSLAGVIEFPVDLNLADEINLYDMLGFEISDFNEILKFALSALGGSDAEAAAEGGLGLDLGIDLSGLKLPPISQQDIIFCSDWSTNAAGRVDLQANKADLMYWFINYIVSALVPDENGNSLLTSLLGDSEMNPTIQGVLEKVVSQFTNNPRGALAAIIEILNPVTYDLTEMKWADSSYNYNGIEGATNMSLVYLNYGNDWTKEKSQYLMDNVDSLVKTILSLTGSEMTDLGSFLAEKVNGLFTNANITALVKMLGGLGDSPSAVINDVVANQVGINIESWFTAFGYLFPAETWAEDAEIIQPGTRYYVNNFGVEGVANEDGTISWFFNKMPLNDGDAYTFVNIISRLLGEASLLIDFLFAGEDVSAFEDVLTIKGYETYDTTFGLLFEMLGVENLPTQADFNADAMGSFTNMLTAVLDWFYALTSSDDMIAQLVEIIPDLFYFIESNGLSTLLHNLLMPILVLVDTVRPLVDVDINGVLSLLVSDFLNYKSLNTSALIQYIIDGNYVNDDPEYTYYSIDINNLTVSEIIKLVDGFLGTNLYESGLVNIGIKGLCSGVAADGSVFRPTVDAADTMTILVTALLDCLSYPTADGKTNGDALFGFIAEMTGKEEIAGLYPAIAEVIAGIEYTYAEPNWGYMFTSVDQFSLILPEQSIVYLGYSTDWTPEVAASVYGALDEVLDLVLPMVLEENETIGTLLNGLLEDNVYSDEILNTLVELIVNALASLDASLFELVDVVVDTDISTWFTFCEIDDATGEYVCTKDWGVDGATDKKSVFIAALKEVLTPANSLLAWLFFGDEFSFFTGSETDAEGNYVFNDVITLNGGEGYAYGIAPIFEALGCTVAPADTFFDAETETYNVADAVEALLNSVFALVDEISANPVEEIFNLLPNVIYFLNADGIKASVSNLLAPVNAIIEKLAPVVGDVSIGGLLSEKIGFDIENITTETLLGLASDAGVTLSPEMVSIIANLYVGKLAEFTSASGRKAYKLDVEGYEGDVLTIVLSIALDAFNLNADLFSDLLGAETYYTVFNLIKGAASEFVYRDMNWAYMYAGDDAASQLYNNNLPDRTGDAYEVYTQYQNNWNEATADYVDEVLETLVTEITAAAGSSSIGQILEDAIANGLYQDDILNSLIEMVVGLLVDYEDIIKSAGALVGAEGLAVWFDDYCEITKDENGETVVTCVKDWGVDAAATNAEKRTAFVEGFVKALQPAYRLLAWLLFGEDFTFFNGTTNDVLVTIKGGEGYNEALVPLLEGLSATMNYSGTASGIKPAAAFYVNGELDMEMAVRDVFTALTDLIDMICNDLAGDGTISDVLAILPNLIYFVNADGLKVVVNNLLQPVNFILDAIKPLGVEVDFATLIDGIDITNLDFYTVFALLEDLLGLYVPEYAQEFLTTFYIGQVVPFESANGKLAYRMTYSDAEPRRDMITVLISFVLDVFVDERNDECLSGLLGEDAYNAIIAVLGIQGVKAMQEFSWILTEYADTDTEFTGLESSKKFEAAYNKVWTEDKAQYISDNLVDFVTDILCLLGLEINGYTVSDLNTLFDAVLEGQLYTQATADSILDLLKSLPELFGEYSEIGKKAITIVDNALGTSIGSWETMTVTVVDGDRDSFIAALEQMLAPIVPVLDLLLCGENIELFYSIDGTGRDALTIYGSEGYAYGIVPLFEALGCTMATPEEFKALDDDAKIGAILTALLDRVDVILADPVNEIFNMLPAIIYFINSNGLDTAVKNIINSVDTVLMALEPILGAPDLMTLLGVDLATFNFEYLMNLAVDSIEESTGIDATPILIDFVAELTTGKVVTYQSANGETYYTMKYAGDWQKSDMVTIVLRLLIDFIAEGQNADAIIALIANNSQSEDATSSASTLIKFCLTALATEPITSGAMATLYYVFYGIHSNVDNIDNEHHQFNKTWKVVLAFFEAYGDPVTKTGVKVLRTILDKYFDGILDSDGVAPEGAMTFFERIAAFFKKIGDFFRRLFGLA